MTRRNAQHALLRYSQHNLVNQEYFSKLREILNKLPGKTRGITNWKKKKRWDYLLPTEKKKWWDYHLEDVRDFPGGPLAKTPSSQCRWPRVQSLVKELGPIGLS